MSAITSPEDCVRAGQLAQALQQLQSRVRTRPADGKDRVFLFQLLALLGQWDRAVAQLDVAADLDPAALMLKQIYRQAVASEAQRARVFDGDATPMMAGEPGAWAAPLLEALRLTARGHMAEGAELRGQALEQAPSRGGSINGERFEWIADADSRLGPCIEIILDGQYMWAPFERVRSIKMEAPTDLRDLIWAQAIITWETGGQTPALIPARYPGAERQDDDELRMARRTEWREAGAETYIGMGQRMLATDAGEYPLLEIREILFDAGGAPA